MQQRSLRTKSRARRRLRLIHANVRSTIHRLGTFPKVLLDKFELMSNSGGSWGADGFLYLTGHDPAELYRARLPKAGSVLELVNTIPMNIRGQGIAWDRSQSGTIYGIIRATAKERIAGGSHRVTVFKLSEKP